MSDSFESKFSEARALFPHTKNVIYFNSASYGPFCTPVADAIKENCELRLRAERDDSHDAFSTQDNLRSRFAELIGANKQEIGVGSNTSFGLNIAAYGLPLNEGDEVLVSDLEFPALAYAWREAAKARGLIIKKIPSSNRFLDTDGLKSVVTDKTKVISVSFVQFFNGFKNDLVEIGQLCKERNIFFVVDGIQGMGVEPINVSELGIDIFSAGCQKWMLSPQGGGFFYLADKVRDKVKHPFTSWLSVDWEMNFNNLFDYEKPLFDSARSFELGYYGVHNILGMDAASKLIQSLGINDIQRHNHQLIDRLVTYFNSNDFYTVTSSLIGKHRSSILTFTCVGYEKLHRALLDQKIILVQREGSIRVSIHLYNNENDIDRLIEALEDFSKKN